MMSKGVACLTTTDEQLLFRILADLVAADTTNPPGCESRAAAVVITFLKTLGITPTCHELAPGRTNVVWTLGKGSQEIFVAAHGDTVPVGDGWTSDPFRLIEKKGRVIGRGVVDNKGPLAGLLVATKLLVGDATRFTSRVTFAMVADEEAGNRAGIDYLLAQNIVRPTLAIIPDSCGSNRAIGIAEKGVLHVRITAHGRQGHGSRPELGINAFDVLDELFAVVRRVPKQFSARDALLGGATVNIGAVHVGTVANIVPGRAEALVDLRFPPAYDAREILTFLKIHARMIAKQWRTKPFAFDILHTSPATATPRTHPLVAATIAAHRAVVGAHVVPIGLPAFTIASTLRRRSIPTVSCGPGELAECHRADESLSKKELSEFVRILTVLLPTLACQKN